MSAQSSNIIPLSRSGDDKPPQCSLFSELNQLVQAIIYPEAEKLIPALSSQLEAHLEEINNDQDIMRWVDIKNRLKKSESSIKKCFINNLTNIENEHSKQNEGALTLELLDNAELDHKLLWFSATKHFESSNNSERICRIKLCLESKYPLHEGTYPAMPERICESFSSAIESLHPDHDIEQQLFVWFACHLKKPADELWLKVDQLLIDKGLKPKQLSPPEILERNSSSSTDQKLVSIPQSYKSRQPAVHQDPYPEMESPQFLDAFADKLVSRLEDMLAEDELIPEAKANRVRAIDLANVLSTLQLEILEQQISIRNLHNSVIGAMEIQGVSSKLSRHHEDLINMIGWLFEYILEDHNLPDEIKKTIALLQIPILKQAILDDAFLTDQEHPARLLLNTLTSAGMQYCKDPKLSSHVLMLIEHTVRTIVSDHSENPDIFQDCLDGFQYNLNIILQPEHDDSKNQNHPIESNEQPLENLNQDQDQDQDQENTIDFQAEIMPEGETELEEEIILSSVKPGISPQEISLSEVNTEMDKDRLELELTVGKSNEITGEQQDYHSTLEPIIIDELHPGQWVEFIGEGDSHRLRCKLARLSKDRHRYIFVNRSGMRVAERSGSDLRKGIENGSVRIMEENPIFDRAIQAVMERFKKH
ncbi:hypothetical protein GV64_08740 [Endozoicomonas elysicola]|uniref:DUF1631 family protein n=2 Tax=Endozoicomonas elysicola TaxID=305900 RepID=A0A081K9J6_9GAMM|nr:hypothetical protein GV64_08740 [Endozoicomonas elysicola]